MDDDEADEEKIDDDEEEDEDRGDDGYLGRREDGQPWPSRAASRLPARGKHV